MADQTKDRERIGTLLRSVVDHFELEDKATRERQIRIWRKMKLYWDGFQRIWFDEVAHDWRTWDFQREETSSEDQEYYDKPVNIFRAYLESIIAALSVTIPPVKCAPDDADDPLDISTAKAGDKIAELIYKHNNVILLWIHALYVYCTEGLIACYNYTHRDKKYGTYTEDETKQEEVEENNLYCPECGFQMSKNIQDEFDPTEIDDCVNCQRSVKPELKRETSFVTRVVGKIEKAKARQCLKVFGGLYVKVPNYAMEQSECPYIILEYETHYANAIERYQDLIDADVKKSARENYKIEPGVTDPYEQWGRLNPQYQGDYPMNSVTIRDSWLRPASFNILDEEDCKLLKERFPDGAHVIFVNELFAEAENRNLDDHWTLTKNPLSDYLHHDPLGMVLASIQDITNDLVSLVLQTIEHGIGQVFADTAVLNFNQYSQQEVSPGSIFPAKSKTGKALGDGFFQVRTASLSGEVLPFGNRIQELGQLVSGALPSLFGGTNVSGSKTAAEYSMSRAQALQRLQTPWKMLSIWWKEIFGKVIPAYIDTIAEDERFVEKDDQGNYVNVFIRKADLQGKIGDIELEAAEQIPITWAQKRDIIMQLMEAGNEVVMKAMASPENLPFIKEAIGLNEFVLPGEEDRQKQYEEIQQLVNSEPLLIPEMNPMNPDEISEKEVPSVEIDPELDDHAVQFDICRRWLLSEPGRQLKLENQEGYKNVLLHAKMHLMMLQQQVMPPEQEMGGQQQNQAVAAPLSGGNPNDSA